MSGIGSGRGRGWLKLEKNKEPQRPGVELNKAEPPQTQIISKEDKTYDELLMQMDCLNPNDDGILLNNKLKYIRDVFMEMCPTENEIFKATQIFNEKCLRNEVFIDKYILLVTSAFFYHHKFTKEQKMWRDAVRRGFINHLQENFEKRKSLRNTSKSMFYNSLNLICSYFNKVKKVCPTGYPALETIAIIGYLDTLLEFGETLDIKMLAILTCDKIEVLMKLYEKKDTRLIVFLDNIKLAVVSNDKLSKKDKIILFFAWDLIRHKYNISSEDLAFYKSNLGEEDIKDILMKYNSNKLDVECPEIKNGSKNYNTSWRDSNSSQRNFDLTAPDISNNTSSYEKSLNTSQSKDSKDQSHASNVKDSFSIHNNSCDKIPQAMKSINLNENKDFITKDYHPNNRQNPEEKIGRPILGIGARLKKN